MAAGFEHDPGTRSPTRRTRASNAYVGALIAAVVLLLVQLALEWDHAYAQEPLAGDLAVELTDDPDPVASGHKLTYTAVITNIGTAPVGTESVPLTVFIQAPPQFVPNTFSATFGGSCVFDSGGLECSFSGPMDPGASATIDLSGTITSATDVEVEAVLLADLPISGWAEAIEVTNNSAFETTNVVASVVGGIAVDSDLRELPLETPHSEGGSAGVLAGVIAGVIAGAVALGGAVWWARMRRSSP